MAQRNPSRHLPTVKNQFRPDSDWIGHISDVTVCPRNSGHVMRSHKLMRHLINCKTTKNSSDAHKMNGENTDLERCPYNSTHFYPVGKQVEHFQQCKARAEDLMARYLAKEKLDDIDNRYGYRFSEKSDQ